MRGIVRARITHDSSADRIRTCIDFVLDLARNGELQSRISRLGSLSVRCARIYAAQIVDALGYMHSKGVIHRQVLLFVGYMRTINPVPLA